MIGFRYRARPGVLDRSARNVLSIGVGRRGVRVASGKNGILNGKKKSSKSLLLYTSRVREAHRLHDRTRRVSIFGPQPTGDR